MTRKLLGLGVLACGLWAAGCESKPATPPKGEKKIARADDDHDHGPGPHGGTVIELGKYHGEFCMDHAKKQATVYILDGSVENPAPIAAEKLLLNIRSPAFQAYLLAVPQEGDPKGKSSRFVATHENFGKEQEFAGTVSGEIDGKPYLGDFQEEEHKDHKGGKNSKAPMDPHGRAVARGDGREAEVYLKPGGIYTEADIKANGSTTVSAKYKGKKWSHDVDPITGDRICPVTLTKANDELRWVIDGKTYTFCCPPCVEEFVTLAKTSPAEVKAPEAYTKK